LESHLFQYLQRNPQQANSAEGVVDAVMTVARKAEISAMKKGLDISSITKRNVSTRSNRMLDKQTQPKEEGDYSEEKAKSLLAANASPLADLLNG